jgi:proline iminopeptidase
MNSSSGSLYVDGTKLSYLIEGAGIPCMIVADRVIHQRALSMELRKHLHFIFPEFRLAIRYDEPPDFSEITLDTLVDDIEQVRRALALGKICVYGHSIFGLLALEYARKYPEQASHVIMIGTPPSFSSIPDWMNMVDDYLQSHASDERRRILKRNRETRTEDTLGSFSPDEAYVLQMMTRAPLDWYDPTYDCSWLFEGANWPHEEEGHDRLWKVFANYDLSQRAPVSTPVFLAVGRHDYISPYTLWGDSQRKLPNLSHNLFGKSGHYPMIEQQQLFDQKLLAWLGIQQ